MPVVIHGGGTIEGIAVGGLPDSIVDADMLASNAVTSAKIIDDAVTSAKIVGSAVTSGALSTGAVLQFVAGTIGNTNFDTDNTNHYIGTYLTITPKRSDSTLVFTMATGIQRESIQSGFTLKASIDDGSNFYWTSGSSSYAWHEGGGSDQDMYWLEGPFGWTRAAGTAGTAETHKIYVQVQTDYRLDFNNYTKGYMHCMEIAA